MAGTTTFERIPSPSTAPLPDATNVAPITPPISACEEDDGRPNHQVPRFQAIAPIRPPRTTVGVIAPASTIPPATVAATSSEMNAPVKFRIAAIVTATFGPSAPVAIVVAIAFAVSWKPFVKSKPRAVTTTRARMMSPPDTGAEAIPPRLRYRWASTRRSQMAAIRLLDRSRDLDTRRDVELVEEVAQVGLDGLRAQEQLGGDLRVRPAVADEPRHLELALGERLDAHAVGPAGARTAVPGLAEPPQLLLGLLEVARGAGRLESLR